MKLPILGEQLSLDQIDLLKTFTKDCRWMILEMTKNSQSGHPGGSLSSIDFLATLYAGVIGQTGERVVISNGHISPAVYSILAEMGYIGREEVTKTFRKIGSIFEGHVTRHVPGVWFGTGPLGVGVAGAAGMAWAERHGGVGRRVFAVLGDGESEEGEVYEMMNFAAKYALDNFIVFCDYNQVQLTDSLANIMPVNIAGHFRAAGWEVLEIDGHDFQQIWGAIDAADKVKGRPILILAKTVMGKGVDFMEKEGLALKSTWHGKTASVEQTDQVIGQFVVDEAEKTLLDEFRQTIHWHPQKPELQWPEKNTLNPGISRLYGLDQLTDCRTAYGMALKDLSDLNPEILALDADLRGSVMTKFLAEAHPDRHIECGIAEQLMISVAGGLSLSGLIPFASTFGAFISSRAKDQARVNDINNTNVKMVATHCGLSVGEDGPTHQAIDDSGSFLGMFNTRMIEPADPNQMDKITRYIATHNGNFYVRMGRHKFPVITDENGQPFYGENYQYEYAKSDLLRSGDFITVVAIGAAVYEALEAWNELAERGKKFELLAVSTISDFDQVLLNSIQKNGRVLTIEDHNLRSGLNSQLATWILKNGLMLKVFSGLGVKQYQLSGKVEELYANAGFFRKNIVEYLEKLF